MDDLDEAMDHFLDIFESAFNARMGFRDPVHDDIIDVWGQVGCQTHFL